MRTTRSPERDYSVLFPELADAWTSTVRLHPRRSAGVDPHASKMGGPIVWPRDATWPSCGSPACDCGGGPLVPVLQLTKSDVPALPFRPGTDLFQLLWCPNDPSGAGPFCRAFWHDAAAERLARVPDALLGHDPSLVPRPCELHPEPVRELPGWWALPADMRERIDAYERAERNGHPDYHYLSSVARGTKVGGHVAWIQDPDVPRCASGHTMEHLLTVASAEFDGGTWPRWCAVEDAHVWGGPYEPRHAVQSAADLMMGDMGSCYVFVCRVCEGWPIASILQCS